MLITSSKDERRKERGKLIKERNRAKFQKNNEVKKENCGRLE